MDIDELLDIYPAERINDAAIECDFTATEIMDEIRRVRNNKKIPYAQRAQHIYNSIMDAINSIEDCLHDEDQEMSGCRYCQGSGGGNEAHLHCPYCKGTGRAAA